MLSLFSNLPTLRDSQGGFEGVENFLNTIPECSRKGESECKRERQREKETERERDRERKRQRERDRERETERERDRKRETERESFESDLHIKQLFIERSCLLAACILTTTAVLLNGIMEFRKLILIEFCSQFVPSLVDGFGCFWDFENGLF